MIELSDIGEGLKKLREEIGKNQSDLCKETGLNQPTLSNIESGKNFNMDAFIILYNYYSQKSDSATVLGKLFNVKDPYTGIIAQKLKVLAEKHQLEIQSIIKTLE
tara:strand:- start:8936 stop:9250 length:315 start_codon:yes stop_codon:yes gene_type:complete